MSALPLKADSNSGKERSDTSSFFSLLFGVHPRKKCRNSAGTLFGGARAKRKGVTFGRKRKLDKEMVRIAAERYAKGETMAELAEVYGVSEPTI